MLSQMIFANYIKTLKIITTLVKDILCISIMDLFPCFSSEFNHTQKILISAVCNNICLVEVLVHFTGHLNNVNPYIKIC